MAKITISDLHTTVEYAELSDLELESVVGGKTPPIAHFHGRKPLRNHVNNAASIRRTRTSNQSKVVDAPSRRSLIGR